MKKFAIMALALAAISLGPISASAAPTVCGDPGDASAAAIPVSTVPAGQGDIYVTDAPGLYQETNGEAGLQTEAKSVGTTFCWNADANLAAAPDPGALPIPDPGTLPIPGLPV
ncbi:MAG: hypothetical protein WDA27_08055 [Actinomycetota bacterium]